MNLLAGTLLILVMLVACGGSSEPGPDIDATIAAAVQATAQAGSASVVDSSPTTIPTVVPSTETPSAPPTPTAVPSPTPVPLPTATPQPIFDFQDGMFRVGIDISPGMYTNVGSPSCYWARLSGFSGGASELITNDFGDEVSIVAIAASDVGFESSSCVGWNKITNTASGGPPASEFSSGTYRVGIDIAPGTYNTAGASDCYWERLSGFSGEASDIITNHFGDGGTIVTISPSDSGFKSSSCGLWKQISDATTNGNSTETSSLSISDPTTREIVVDGTINPPALAQTVHSRFVDDSVFGPLGLRWTHRTISPNENLPNGASFWSSGDSNDWRYRTYSTPDLDSFFMDSPFTLNFNGNNAISAAKKIEFLERARLVFLAFDITEIAADELVSFIDADLTLVEDVGLKVIVGPYTVSFGHTPANNAGLGYPEVFSLGIRWD